MVDQVPTLQNLLRVLQQMPYLASKNVYRVAHYLITLDDTRREQLVRIIADLPRTLARCRICCSWYEQGAACAWCHDPRRDQSIICVVQQWFDVYAVEKSGIHGGVYHILGGVISPLDGVRPDDLSGAALIERIIKGGCVEIILALSQTPEGDATAAYISKLIERQMGSQAGPLAVKITCLSRGAPVGSSLETLDRVTLSKAFAERRPF